MTQFDLEIGALRLRRVLYADVLVPPDIAGLTVSQIEAVPWRVPQWGEGEQIRASASAWVVDADERRLVLDPMQAADNVLHDPEGEGFHQQAIADVFTQAAVPRESVDTVVVSHIEGIGLVGERCADGSWTRFFPNARILVSEAARADFAVSPQYYATPVWQQFIDEGTVDTFADGEEIVPGMRAEVSKAHNPGHTVFHFGAGPDATFVGHLAVSPLHLATGLCPQQHPEPELAWKLLHDYADDGRILIGPLWPSPGYGRWSDDTFSGTPRQTRDLPPNDEPTRRLAPLHRFECLRNLVEAQLAPNDRADPARAQQLEDRRVRSLAFGARRPVESERAPRPERIVDVHETHTAHVEVAVRERAGVNAPSSSWMSWLKPAIKWRPFMPMQRNVCSVTVPPTVSNATSTPCPYVSSSTAATKSSRR